MSKELSIIKNEEINNKIYTIRGLQVMLDNELAELYGVETRVFNQAVKRNIARFPENFRFELTEDEYGFLRSQIVTFKKEKNLKSQNATLENNSNLRSQIVTSSLNYGGRRYLPYVFTEQGVSMLSAVLRSKTAIDMSIKIINSFVNMRKFLSSNRELFQRLDLIEKRQISFEMKTDDKIDNILNAIEDKSIKSKQGIFFNGQIFDAYIFVSDLIRSATNSIVLIDNYIDESVLLLLSKRNNNCKATIYTKTIKPQLKLDLKKHNMQYPKIDIKIFSDAHDRFMILDGNDIYHIGASLKDLGKKWFAFSKFESGALDMLEKLESYE